MVYLTTLSYHRMGFVERHNDQYGNGSGCVTTGLVTWIMLRENDPVTEKNHERLQSR
jgi:hypothetical protein